MRRSRSGSETWQVRGAWSERSGTRTTSHPKAKMVERPTYGFGRSVFLEDVGVPRADLLQRHGVSIEAPQSASAR